MVIFIELLNLKTSNAYAGSLTQVVLELLGASVLSGGDQVPHEAFDFVVSAVVDQAVGQQGPADGLHVPLGQLLLEAAVCEDVLPSTPPGSHTPRQQNRFCCCPDPYLTLHHCVHFNHFSHFKSFSSRVL